jgi:hypothetical protein
VGWNNEQDRQRLLRIIIKRIEVGKGIVRVQIDPAAALADDTEGLRREPQTVEIACNLVRGASGVQIAIGILKPDSDSHHWQAGLQKAKFEPGFESEPLPTQPSLVLTGGRK